MEKKQMILLLTKIHCDEASPETGHDEIYFEIFEVIDGVEHHLGHHYKDNPLEMGEDDNHDNAYVDISINVTYMDKLRVKLMEKDDDSSDELGYYEFSRNEPIESYKELIHPVGNTDYRLYYRIIDQPIPTLRVMGVHCEEDSKGCNVDMVEAVFEVSAEASNVASELLKKNPRPRAKAMSKAFARASEVLGNIAGIVTWIFDAAEGPDEVYMQHVDPDTHEVEGGPFWPSEGVYHHMESGDEVHFTSNDTGTLREYYRFPMDAGPVTIQLREQDNHSTDDNIGAYTFDQNYYDTYKEKGARILVCDEYFNHSGQGALYNICVSVGMENWALPPSFEAQGGYLERSDSGEWKVSDISLRDTEWRHFWMEVPAGCNNMKAVLSCLDGDLDLYVRKGAKADSDNYDYMAASGGSDELSISNPQADVWYFSIYAYRDYSSGGLSITCS